MAQRTSTLFAVAKEEYRFITMFLTAFLLLPALMLEPGQFYAATNPASSPQVQQTVEDASRPRRWYKLRGADWNDAGKVFRPPVARQVRIEQRVIIRIVPLGRQAADPLIPAAQSVPLRIVERPIAGCVPVNQIAGVAGDRGDRLRLLMRSRQVLSVRFGSECRTEAFYSGFFVERKRDGLLCPARDAIHSRSGMRCTVGRISQLVAERAN